MQEEPQVQNESSTITSTQPSVENVSETRLQNLPSLDDLKRSEVEIVKPKAEIKGLKSVEQETLVENKTFKRKEDETRAFYKKRFKVLTSVYVTVLVLLLGFVGVNISTLAILNKDINSNTATIQAETEKVEFYESQADMPSEPKGSIQISLNEPRDYGDDEKELTFLDKITIIFRNLFG